MTIGKKVSSRTGVLAGVVLGLACFGASSPDFGEVSLAGESMEIRVAAEPFSLRVLDADGREMLGTVGPVSFTRVTRQRVSRFVLWWFWTRGYMRPWKQADTVVALDSDGETIRVGLSDRPGGPALVRVTAGFRDHRTAYVNAEVVGMVDINRVRLRLKRDGDDRFYGMGERFNAVEHSGTEVRVWSEEGGLGLSYLSEVAPNVSFNPFPKGPDTTYYPVPFYMNPKKGHGLLLDDVHYSVFDFGRARKDRVTIENWNDRLDLLVFAGRDPLSIIEAQTAYTGRVEPPPAWAFAPMGAIVEGQERVLEVAELLRREGIPATAIWSESWWWRTEWEVNRELYPDYELMNRTLREKGFRHLAYYQPYLTEGTEAWKEGDRKGYLTKKPNGETYGFRLGLATKAQLDVTNPEAVLWWKQSFFAKSESMGADGWMHDFGEHTPPDSVAHDGRSGWELHNEYPLLWAKMGKEFFDQARPDNDYVIYIRGGYTGVQKYANVMWTGDQNANFEKLDGLPANLPAVLSVGISGHPVPATDIAGYNCFVNRSADRELFMRWTELGALLPVMRLHRGNDEVCDHWEFDRDRETLDHFKKYSILHTELFPYFFTLTHEAARRGWPVVRHLLLHYPDDPAVEGLDYQFLIGDRLLAAPVIERDARSRELYLPEGRWTHWWTGDVYDGPARVTVGAELGEVPLFALAGKVIPLFGGKVDSLVLEDIPGVNTFDDANSELKAVFFGTGRDSYELWDGTVIECSRQAGEAGTCRVEGAPVERSYTFEFK